MANDKQHQTQDENQRKTNIQPSETGNQTGDPGRTPGKAEGEDDSSAIDGGLQQKDTEKYEKTKERKLSETAATAKDERN